MAWHNGVIPEEEIWVKIGGDKGGGSFKMSLQICNVPHPNSVQNTFVFCAFEADDNLINLNIALKEYNEQLLELQEMKWQ